MVKKYIAMRVPLEAYQSLQKKQATMEQVAKELTGKSTPVPMTRVITAVSENPVTFRDEYLLKLLKRGWRVMK